MELSKREQPGRKGEEGKMCMCMVCLWMSSMSAQTRRGAPAIATEAIIGRCKPTCQIRHEDLSATVSQMRHARVQTCKHRKNDAQQCRRPWLRHPIGQEQHNPQSGPNRNSVHEMMDLSTSPSKRCKPAQRCERRPASRPHSAGTASKQQARSDPQTPSQRFQTAMPQAR